MAQTLPMSKNYMTQKPKKAKKCHEIHRNFPKCIDDVANINIISRICMKRYCTMTLPYFGRFLNTISKVSLKLSYIVEIQYKPVTSGHSKNITF